MGGKAVEPDAGAVLGGVLVVGLALLAPFVPLIALALSPGRERAPTRARGPLVTDNNDAHSREGYV